MALWGPSINNQYEGTRNVCAYIQWAKLGGENLCEGFFGPPKKRKKKAKKREKAILPSGDNWLFPPNVKNGKVLCVRTLCKALPLVKILYGKKSDFSSSTSAAAATQLLLLCWRIFFGALDRTNSVSPIGRLIKGGGKYTDYFLNVFFV